MSPVLPEPTHDQPCPICGRAKSMALKQVNCDGKLRWHQSICCAQCGRQEAHDRGLPPKTVRDLPMAKDGRWTLMASIESDSIAIAEVLSVSLGQSLKEAISVLKQLPKIYRGTHVECLWLQGLLKSGDVDSVVVKEDC